MKKYKAIFFDLDHTLWDFDRNSGEAIAELFTSCKLEDRGVSDVAQFINAYREINSTMWADYHKNNISKEYLRYGRFNLTLKKFNLIDELLAAHLADEYLKICPVKTHLFPDTIQVLEYLSKKYSLHIITNGFREVQHLKISNSGIEKYFSNVHISEEIGYKKPEPEIFHYAVKESGVSHEYCLMIGDNAETDIAGAENAGIDSILFNPLRLESSIIIQKQIHQLTDLLKFL